MLGRVYLRNNRVLTQVRSAGIYSKNTDFDKGSYDAKKAEDDLLITYYKNYMNDLKLSEEERKLFKEKAEKLPPFKCKSVHLLRYVSNDQIRFTILQIITNLVSAEILPDVKQAPSSASKGYLIDFFLNRIMSRSMSILLPKTLIPPINTKT